MLNLSGLQDTKSQTFSTNFLVKLWYKSFIICCSCIFISNYNLLSQKCTYRTCIASVESLNMP